MPSSEVFDNFLPPSKANIKPNTTYRFKIKVTNVGIASYSTCEKIIKTKPLPKLDNFSLGEKNGEIEANWDEVEGVEKYEIKVYELNNDEYSFVKILDKDELENFDTREAGSRDFVVYIWPN